VKWRGDNQGKELNPPKMTGGKAQNDRSSNKRIAKKCEKKVVRTSSTPTLDGGGGWGGS